MHEETNTPAAERSEPVRKLNVQIRKVIEWLPHGKDCSPGFFCECGCCESVELTLAEYDALEGKPIYLAYHLAPEATSALTSHLRSGTGRTPLLGSESEQAEGATPAARPLPSTRAP